MALMAVSANAGSRTTLWEGEATMNSSWPSITLDKSLLASVKADDQIVVTISSADNNINTDWKYGPQIFLKVTGESWSDPTGVGGKYPEKGAGVGEYIFRLTEEAAAEAAASGLAVQGMNVVITKVELEAAVATTAKALTLDGNHLHSSEFDEYPDDYDVKLTINNVSNPYASRNGWGIGGFANINNWTPTYSITGQDGTSFDVFVKVKDLKDAAKNGTDAYVADEYSQTGVTFNIYNDCELAGIWVLVPVTTGINSLNAAAQQNAVRYNLAGQKVGAGFKGVVIENGKKLIVK